MHPFCTVLSTSTTIFKTRSSASNPQKFNERPEASRTDCIPLFAATFAHFQIFTDCLEERMMLSSDSCRTTGQNEVADFPFAVRTISFSF